MATTTAKKTGTKTTARKVTTAPVATTEKVADDFMNKPEEPKVEETVEKKETKISAKQSFNPTDEILCTSIVSGELIMIGKKTGTHYTWSNAGDVAYVEYQDLQSAKVGKHPSIYAPQFVIEDDEVLKQWSDVKAIYDNMYSADDLSQIFNLSIGKFEEVIKGLPLGAKQSVATMAASMVQDGSLDSVSKIKVLDVVLGTDLMTYLS